MSPVCSMVHQALMYPRTAAAARGRSQAHSVEGEEISAHQRNTVCHGCDSPGAACQPGSCPRTLRRTRPFRQSWSTRCWANSEDAVRCWLRTTVACPLEGEWQPSCSLGSISCGRWRWTTASCGTAHFSCEPPADAILYSCYILALPCHRVKQRNRRMICIVSVAGRNLQLTLAG